MSETKFDLIMAVFDTEEAASNSYKELHQAEKKKLIDTENVVVIYKEDEGKIHVKETAEKVAGEATIGALVGGALGILAGPLGIVTFSAAGAALGGLAAKLDDVGFDDTSLARIAESLEPGSSAIITVLDGQYSERLVEELKKRDAQVAVEPLPRDFGKLLDEGDGWAYRIASGEADEAARELGLIKPESKTFVSDLEDHSEMKSDEDDPNAAFPKL
jgi:uncharacterized membrane protein